MQLTIFDQLPEAVLNCRADQLYEYFPGPSLVKIKGNKDQVVFVSVLLHGNEYSGWDAVRDLLNSYQDQLLPRSLYLFLGNVEAARQGKRLLEGQQDFNRIWKNASKEGDYAFAGQLLEELSIVKPVMAIDVHNNTGLNPHYACVNRLDKDYLHLATLFSRTVVYFTSPDAVLSLALSEICPSVTVECGKPEDSSGEQHALNFLQACMHLDHFPQHNVVEQDIDVFHTVATVKVKAGVTIGFGDEPADIRFIDKLDSLNFNELSKPTVFAQTSAQNGVPFEISDENGNDISDRYFANNDGDIVTTSPVMPSMLTLNTDIIRQDCLCYLMERYPLKQG